jgi:hypothetical protein
MRSFFTFIQLAVTCIIMAQSVMAQSSNASKPSMLDDSDYTEYWEQYLYLSDGSLITSQFLVANFPWPVGNEHGVMLGTLVTPEGELYVIKNGRDRGEWGFNDNAFDIFIHTHRLKQQNGGYSLHLENTMGIADMELASKFPSFDHNKYSSEDGSIQTSFYAPFLSGRGNWHLGPEAGFNPSGPVHKVDQASGFGVHVLMTDKVDQLMKNWTRVVGVSSQEEKPFLSAITRPDQKEDIIFKLLGNGEVIDEFDDINVKYERMTKEKDASYPKRITISAKGNNGEISGTINYGKKFNHFNLTDHLNFFEKSFAQSNPVVTNFRYLADYDLVYKTAEGEKRLTGKALSEFTDIQPPRKAPAKQRRRNRR